MSDIPKRQTYSVRVRSEIMDQLRHLAIDEHASLSDLLERAIMVMLEEHPLKPSRGKDQDSE